MESNRTCEDLNEALQIQAAAVVAQQSALSEEEVRLEQRRAALEQHEAQLAKHLDEKRRRLVELRDQCQEARALLLEERLAHERNVIATTREMDLGKAALADREAQVRSDRRRLLSLRGRLRQRLHRHWQAREQALGRERERLEQAQALLYQDREQLRREKSAFNQVRLGWNGDLELAKRQQAAAWCQLREEQHRWEARRQWDESALEASARAVEEQGAALAQAREALAVERQDWDLGRSHRRLEVEGLETRAVHLRSRLLKLETQISQASALVQAPAKTDEAASVGNDGPEPPTQAPGRDRDLTLRVHNLDQLAAELLDQRAQLAEHWERVATTEDQWQRQRAVAMRELETTGRELTERAQKLWTEEGGCRHRQLEAAHLRRQLEAWQAQLTARALAWEGERERCRAEVRGREEVVEQQLCILGGLRRRWHGRQRKDVARLRAALSGCNALRQEFAVLRDQWLKRTAELASEERRLGESALALEQHRQGLIVRAPDPAAAERKFDLLRRRCAEMCAEHTEKLAAEREALQQELAHLEMRAVQVQGQADEVAGRSAAVSRLEMNFEHQQALAEGETVHLRRDVQILRVKQAGYERQIKELNDEVQRLAVVILDDAEVESPAAARAA
jgi:hypothetical protein